MKLISPDFDNSSKTPLYIQLYNKVMSDLMYSNFFWRKAAVAEKAGKGPFRQRHYSRPCLQPADGRGLYLQRASVGLLCFAAGLRRQP